MRREKYILALLSYDNWNNFNGFHTEINAFEHSREN